jgi:serine phosphatase RsbU (regulator of sigma subunit)
MTDGVVEASNKEGELFGFARTQFLSRQTAEKIAETAQSFGQDDDITVLTVTRSARTGDITRPQEL